MPVGAFAGDHWKEWNGQFRDDVRSFVRGDPGMVTAPADRLLGSPTLYAADPREPAQSINFVASHDGPTLYDLVSYNDKHNLANGEGNRDGSDDNRSWNCGVEGTTDDPGVLSLRKRQVKNLLAINLLSLGTPMLLMGDEMGRSQQPVRLRQPQRQADQGAVLRPQRLVRVRVGQTPGSRSVHR
jgi:isoamylase